MTCFHHFAVHLLFAAAEPAWNQPQEPAAVSRQRYSATIKEAQARARGGGGAGVSIVLSTVSATAL